MSSPPIRRPRYSLKGSIDLNATPSVDAPARPFGTAWISDAANVALQGFQHIVERNRALLAERQDEINCRTYVSAKECARDLEAARVTSANELLGDLYQHIINARIDPNNLVLLYARDFTRVESGLYISMFGVGPRLVEAKIRAALRRKAEPTDTAVRRNLAVHGKSAEDRLRAEYEESLRSFASRFMDSELRDGYIGFARGNPGLDDEHAVVGVPVMSMPVYAPGGTPANPDGRSPIGTLVSTCWAIDDGLRNYLRATYRDLFDAAGNDYRVAMNRK